MQEMKETQVRSPDQEDPLEEEIATPSSILARKSSWTVEPGRLHTTWSRKSRTGLGEHTHMHTEADQGFMGSEVYSI